MSTKPSVHAEWDTNGTNMSATSSGHKSDGWANNEVPTAAEFNHWQNQVSAWTEWLFDGDIDVNDLLVGGTLGVTGASTLADVSMSNLIVTASTKYTGIYTKSLTGTALSPGPNMNSNVDVRGSGNNVTGLYEAKISVTGAGIHAALGGVAGGVDGQEILLTALNFFYIAHEDTASTAANRIYLPNEASDLDNPYAPQMITIPKYGCARLRYIGSLSRWVVVAYSSTPTMEGLVREMIVPVSMARDFNNTHTSIESQITLGASANTIHYPIHIPGDYEIMEWSLHIQKNTSTGTMTGRIYATSYGTVTAQGSGDTETGNAVGDTTLTETGLSISSFTNRSHFLRLTPTGGITPSADKAFDLWIKYISYTQ